MAFTNTQTKLGEAITTNAAGDYAVRTTIEGDQNLGGGYILNDQTTTNMMSKGTVYQFDGSTSNIVVTDSAEIQNIFTNGGFFSAWIYPISDGEANFGRIIDKSTAGTGGYSCFVNSEVGGLVKVSFFRKHVTTNGQWNTDTIIPISVWSHVLITYGDTGDPLIYINGLPVTVTESSTPVGAVVTDVGDNLIVGDRSSGGVAFDGSIAEVMLGNFAPTADQVKSLISGNLDFKWQYGSQTAQTSGTLEVGQAYIIDDWITADDFTNVGGANVDGTIFVATGTTPTTWANSSSLRPLGATFLADQTSITANNWFDLANGNTGAVTGASVLNPNAVSTDEDNIPNFSITSGITADTGSAQGNGVLTSSINQISVCANAGDAVTLPSAKPGKVLWVVNDGANASDVFPASGDNIDEAGANTAKSLPADGEMQFICTSAGHWSTITSA